MVRLTGPGPGWDVLKKLEDDEKLMGIESAKAGLADMRLLFEYLEVFGVLDKVCHFVPCPLSRLILQMSFDMSLARGLDYYTGLIYEAITEFSAPPSAKPTPSVPTPDATTSSTPTSLPTKADKKAKASDKDKAKTEDDAVDEASVGVGSIAAGGRYDNLVGMFAEAAGQKRDQVPCVGISIGVERVYSIMEMRRKNREEKIRGKETDVYVLALGGGLLKERMAFAKMLRDNGIKVGCVAGFGGFADQVDRVHVQGKAKSTRAVEGCGRR